MIMNGRQSGGSVKQEYIDRQYSVSGMGTPVIIRQQTQLNNGSSTQGSFLLSPVSVDPSPPQLSKKEALLSVVESNIAAQQNGMLSCDTQSLVSPTSSTTGTATLDEISPTNGYGTAMFERPISPPRKRGRPPGAISQSPISRTNFARHRCPECHKHFQNNSALIKHRLTHSTERRYVCNVCNKGFKRQDHLSGHKNVHREVKPFPCVAEGCLRSYSDARSLRRHLEQQHSFVRPTVHSQKGMVRVTHSMGTVVERPMNQCGDGSNVEGEERRSPAPPPLTRAPFDEFQPSALSTASSPLQQFLTSRTNPATPCDSVRCSSSGGAVGSTLLVTGLPTSATPSYDPPQFTPAQTDWHQPQSQRPCSFECRQCGKLFRSVAALNGHMRSHSLMRQMESRGEQNFDSNVSTPPYFDPRCNGVLSPVSAVVHAVAQPHQTSWTSPLPTAENLFMQQQSQSMFASSQTPTVSPNGSSTSSGIHAFQQQQQYNNCNNNNNMPCLSAPSSQPTSCLQSPVQTHLQSHQSQPVGSTYDGYDWSNPCPTTSQQQSYYQQQPYPGAEPAQSLYQQHQYQPPPQSQHAQQFVSTSGGAFTPSRLEPTMDSIPDDDIIEREMASITSKWDSQSDSHLLPGTRLVPAPNCYYDDGLQQEEVSIAGCIPTYENDNSTMRSEDFVVEAFLGARNEAQGMAPLPEDNAGTLETGQTEGQTDERQRHHTAPGCIPASQAAVETRVIVKTRRPMGKPEQLLFALQKTGAVVARAASRGKSKTTRRRNKTPRAGRPQRGLFSLPGSPTRFGPHRRSRLKKPAPLRFDASTSAMGDPSDHSARQRFCSQLRSPFAFSEVTDGCSPPPYTPPPILAPVRHGTGLFCKVALSSSVDLRHRSQPGISPPPTAPYQLESGFLTNNISLPADTTPGLALNPVSLPVAADPPPATVEPPPLSIEIETTTPAPHVQVSPASTDSATTSSTSSAVDHIVALPPPTSCWAHINQGLQYQAVIPDWQGGRNSSRLHLPEQADLVWSPECLDRLTDDEYNSYMKLASSVAVCGSGRNTELALQVLHRCDGRIQDATRQLLATRGPPDSETWSTEAVRSFADLLLKCDKDFHTIAHQMETKSVKQCVEFYYVWKMYWPETHRARFLDKRKQQERVLSSYNLRPGASNSILRRPQAQLVLEGEGESQGERTMSQEDSSAAPSPARRLTRVQRNSVGKTSASGSDDRFPCKLCNRVFEKAKSRNAHMKSHAMKGEFTMDSRAPRARQMRQQQQAAQEMCFG